MVVPQVPDEGADLDDLLGIQAHGGFVQNHHLGVPQKGLGDAHPLLVPLGEVLDEPLGHIRNPGDLHDVVDLLVQILLGHPFGLTDEGEVFPGGPIQVEGRPLRQVTQQTLGRAGLLENVMPTHGDGTRRGGQTSRHDVHGGGLSCPIGAQQAVDLPLLDVEGQVGNGGVGAIPFG